MKILKGAAYFIPVTKFVKQGMSKILKKFCRESFLIFLGGSR